LDVGDGGPFGLRELNFGPKQKCPQTKVSEGEHNVEIFVHVTMVKQVVAVEAEEEAGAFNVALPGQVHAPMDVFIHAIISNARGIEPQRKYQWPESQEKLTKGIEPTSTSTGPFHQAIGWCAYPPPFSGHTSRPPGRYDDELWHAVQTRR